MAIREYTTSFYQLATTIYETPKLNLQNPLINQPPPPLKKNKRQPSAGWWHQPGQKGLPHGQATTDTWRPVCPGSWPNQDKRFWALVMTLQPRFRNRDKWASGTGTNGPFSTSASHLPLGVTNEGRENYLPHRINNLSYPLLYHWCGQTQCHC